jgi:predicted TIM-barrel fold metal-dependent hydrolase
MVPGGAVLMPYLDDRWHTFGTPPPVIGLTLYNQVQGAIREDTLPHLHGYPPGMPGSSYGLMKAQLLDPFDYELAVLTGFFHVGGMRTQFEYWQAMATAYNAWLADTWLGVDERIRGSIQVAHQQPEAAAAEIERCASNPGFAQVMLPSITTEGYGLKKYRPMFEAAARHDLVVALHFGWATSTATGDPPYYCELHVGLNQSYMAQLGSLVMSGIFDELPNLRVLMLEAVWAWVPSLMWSLDDSYELYADQARKLDRKPSEYVRDNFWFSTQPMPEPRRNEDLLRLIDMVGSDEWLCYSSDYPHWDYDPPDVVPRSWPEDLRRKVMHDNALRLYSKRLGNLLVSGRTRGAEPPA